MLYCYFIARAGAEVEGLPYRTWEAAISFVREGNLIAAVREARPGARATPEWMLEYNAVLTAASKRATVLPVRFGTGFRTSSGVRRLLAARGAELAETLDRLEGKAEMILRVGLGEGESAARRAADLAQNARPLDHRFEVHPDRAGASVLEAAHLIEREQAPEYRRRLERPGVEITGPWPPLHFLPQFLRRPVRAERGRPRRPTRAQAG